MKTLINNNKVVEAMNTVFNRNNKIMSVADVWNIQRHKRNRVQRRIVL